MRVGGLGGWAGGFRGVSDLASSFIVCTLVTYCNQLLLSWLVSQLV